MVYTTLATCCKFSVYSKISPVSSICAQQQYVIFISLIDHVQLSVMPGVTLAWQELSENPKWAQRIIVCVSHDRAFLDDVTTDQLHISGIDSLQTNPLDWTIFQLSSLCTAAPQSIRWCLSMYLEDKQYRRCSHWNHSIHTNPVDIFDTTTTVKRDLLSVLP